MVFPDRWRIPGLVALYAILAGLYFFLSEQLLVLLAPDPTRLTHLQTATGWGFVAVTAALFFLILRHEARARDARDQALRDSEETYRTLIEVETDAVFLIENATGRILTANPAAAALYGYTQQELLGLRNSDLSAEPGETTEATATAPLTPDAIVRIPLRHHKKRDGTVFPVEITGRFFVWRGRPVHLAAVRDITDRQRAEAALARYRVLAEQARDIVLFVRRDGRILETNEAAAAAYGYTSEELRALHIQDLRAPETRVLTPSQMAQADAEGILFETVHRRKDGSTFPVEVSSRGADIYGERVLLSIIRDITDRKGAEEALAARTQHLDAVRVVTEEITRELDVARLLRLLIARAAELVGATAGTVYLWDPVEELLVPAAWHGLGDWQESLRLRLGQGIAGTVAQTRRTLVANDYRTSPYAHPVTLEHTGLTASMGEPLLYRDALIGAITIGHDRGHTFAAPDQEVLRHFAAQAAIAIQNARLYDAIQRELRQREAAEADLRKIVLAVEQSPAIVLITDTRGIIEYVNPKFTEVTGYTLDEVRGKNPRILKSGHTTGAEYATLWATLTAGKEWQGEFHNRRKDGTLYWEAASISPVRNAEGRITHYVGVKEDVTARKAANSALRQYASQLEAVRAVSEEILQELDLGKVLHLVVRRACALTRAAAGDIDLWNPERELLVSEVSYGHTAPRPLTERKLGEGAMGTVAETRRGMLLNDYRSSAVAHPETLARTTITASLVEPLLYRDTLLGVIGVDHETPGSTFSPQDQAVLQLFAAQAAIAIANARLFREERERREQLEALRATTADIIRELDVAKLLTLFIERAVGLLAGVSGTVYLFDPAAGVITPKAWVGHGDWLAETRLRPGEGIAGTIIQQREGLIENAYRASAYALPNFLDRTNHTAVLGEPLVYHDRLIGAVLVDRKDRAFSERDRELLRLFADQAAIAIENARLYTTTQDALQGLRQAQEELVRSEKLRGLGQMAAGIAHELNNTLATILGQTELLRMRPHPPDVAERLQMLQTAANDGAHVVRRLQDFARQDAGTRLGSCDLAQVVPETLELTRPRWQEEPQRQGIIVETAVDLAGLPPIAGNPAEVREVLTNLIFNAVDAMPSGGRMSFSGRVVEGPGERDATELADGASKPETSAAAVSSAWVELEVSDTGIGMVEEVKRRAFDPFFTTKGFQGTGLGLSVVYGIMERHGGEIDITSAPGRGTTFRLRFRPAASVDTAVARGPAAKHVPACRILVVDDDASVRRTLVALLRASGQSVLEADGGAAALKCLDQGSVDLVITDLGMPHVTGWDVARAAKARQPALPVVLLTGWGEQVGADWPAAASVDRVLTKPVPRSTVLAVIAELTTRHVGT